MTGLIQPWFFKLLNQLPEFITQPFPLIAGFPGVQRTHSP